MGEQVETLHYYWSAKHGCVVTSETSHEEMAKRGNWGQYVTCSYLSEDPMDRGWLGRHDNPEYCKYRMTHAHGRDLHPINEMEILAIQAHPEPWTIMPRAY